ncbi:hypothetical protein [Rhizobium chutanense]|uniref:Uncharacterized protein n=1 Tax=Rhizobium chutanense TaxID=2035448 RepID=A0A3S0Q1H5_9HYPH|nr:hypothetical protein [Rhizobium chutanense]RUL97999.1 hypothetical protein EFR84_29770 [Rhizobium chutanense]
MAVLAEPSEAQNSRSSCLKESKATSHLVDTAVSEFGSIDVMLNNVGLMPLDDVDINEILSRPTAQAV